MKTILVIMVVLITSTIPLFSAVQAKEKLIACGHPDYPPFMWREGENTVGVAAEVVEILFREIDMKVISKNIGNWKRCLSTIKSGKTDLIVSAYRTDERMKYAKFTQIPLSADPSAIFVWKGREFKFDNWEDLIGKNAGVLLGESHGQKFDLFLEENVNTQHVSRRLQNYKKLELGRIDFETTGLHTGLIQTKRYGYGEKIIALKTPVVTNYLYIAMSKKSKYLRYLPQIELGLQKLKADGTIERLIKKYTDYYVETTTNDDNS